MEQLQARLGSSLDQANLKNNLTLLDRNACFLYHFRCRRGIIVSHLMGRNNLTLIWLALSEAVGISSHRYWAVDVRWG